jgi:hypothetical protein
MGTDIPNCPQIAFDTASDSERLNSQDDPALFATLEYDAPFRDGPRTPDFAVKVSDGWLAGTDVGEWGGEMIHIADDGSKAYLIDENVEGIHSFGSDFVAVTGLAHLTFNRGAVYRVSQDANGDWSATVWRRLPGAPISSSVVESGELRIDTCSGSLVISQDGSMRMAPCAE